MMPETKTLSKVEQFALVAAREKAQEAGATFNDLIQDVAAAHGVDQAAGPDWQFNRNFSAMIYVPRPKQKEALPIEE
jgi:hypothetical protein